MTFILLKLLSQTNSSLQNSLAPEMISLGSTKNSNRLLDKETKLFRNIGNQVNLLIEKSFLTSSTYSDVASNDLTSKTNTKKPLHFSNIPNKILPLLHLYTNTILSIRTTPRKSQTFMNSSSLFLVGSLLIASAPFVT